MQLSIFIIVSKPCVKLNEWKTCTKYLKSIQKLWIKVIWKCNPAWNYPIGKSTSINEWMKKTVMNKWMKNLYELFEKYSKAMDKSNLRERVSSLFKTS